MSDKALLKLFQNREYFYRFREFVKDYSVQKETKYILDKYQHYFDNVSEEFVLEDFMGLVAQVDQLNEERFNKFRDVMLAVESYRNEALAEEIIHGYLQRELAEQLADICNRGIDGEGVDSQQIRELLDEFDLEVKKEAEEQFEFAPNTIEGLFELNKNQAGLTWSLPSLNTHYGNAKPGDLIHIFANSNVGKTSFVVGECLHFMKQLRNDKKILWINNEEMVTRVNQRFYHHAYGGNPFTGSWEERKTAQEQVDAMFNLSERLYSFQAPTGSFSQRDYEQILDKVRPEVVVFNNLDKIKAQPDDTNSAQHLTQIYYWAREMASMFNCVVMGVGQADAEAINRLKLDKSNLANCKVGKAGECDLIIGIGYNDQDPEHRQINLVKNKFGDEVSFGCSFDARTGRYTEKVMNTYGY